METSHSNQSFKTVRKYGWHMIREAMTAWLDVTEKLLAIPIAGTTADEREGIIADVEGYLDERDLLQGQIVAPFTAEEEVLGKKLIAMEADVEKKLTLIRKQIKINISESQSKKDHMKTYINPYSKVARDGTFYDTKQ
ncbi:hypothetical protein ACXYMX_00650 [Sporosarcina sp. CAU 1771]